MRIDGRSFLELSGAREQMHKNKFVVSDAVGGTKATAAIDGISRDIARYMSIGPLAAPVAVFGKPGRSASVSQPKGPRQRGARGGVS